MFYLCPYAINTLAFVCDKLKICSLVYHSNEACLSWWLQRGETVRPIPILFHWNIWVTRNRKIFEGTLRNPSITAFQIIFSWEQLKPISKPSANLSKRLTPRAICYPLGYFDGTSHHSICGCGAWLLVSPDCHYKIFWNGGVGTNTKAEVLALWGLLWFANHLYMDKIWIIGDSKVLIDHMNHKDVINLGSMVHSLEKINLLKSTFSEISFHHVYREKNDIADRLSKKMLKAILEKCTISVRRRMAMEHLEP